MRGPFLEGAIFKVNIDKWGELGSLGFFFIYGGNHHNFDN